MPTRTMIHVDPGDGNHHSRRRLTHRRPSSPFRGSTTPRNPKGPLPRWECRVTCLRLETVGPSHETLSPCRPNSMELCVAASKIGLGPATMAVKARTVKRPRAAQRRESAPDRSHMATCGSQLFELSAWICHATPASAEVL